MKSFVALIAILFSITHTLLAQTNSYEQQDADITVIAHRGGIVPGFPENTLAAFHNAISQGVQVIEIDLRSTKDGIIVIMHDETLERTTNGNGKVSDHTFDEIKTLDAGDGERIPTYEEVLQLAATTGVNLLLDIKQSPVLDRVNVVRLAEKHKTVDKIIVGVRSIEDLKAFRTLNSQLRTLGFVPEITDIDLFVKANVGVVRLWPNWIASNKGLVEKVRRSGKPVWVTAGDIQRYELEKLINLGVSGILLDDPTLIRSLGSQNKRD